MSLIDRLNERAEYHLLRYDSKSADAFYDAIPALIAANKMADAIEAYLNGDVGSAWKLDVEDTLAEYRAIIKEIN